MKIHLSIRSLTAVATTVFGLALADPVIAIAGEYEEALALVEASVGPVGDTNTGEPGSVAYRIIDRAIEAKALKASGDDAGALAKIQEAEAIVVGAQ